MDGRRETSTEKRNRFLFWKEKQARAMVDSCSSKEEI